MVKKTFRIEGMTCNSCAHLIESKLKERSGVKSVSASYSKGEAEVDFESNKVSIAEIKKIIEKEGYKVADEKKEDSKESGSDNLGDKIGFWFMIASLCVLVYFIYKWVSGFNIEIPGVGDQTGLIILFFVGVLTGFHCVSMCGAFVISYTTKNANSGHKGYLQHFVYGSSKVVSYAVIGGIFGFIGGIVSFSVGLRAGVAIFAGVFMIFYALSMLGIGFFKRFQFNPKFLTRWTVKASKKAKGPYFAPFVTGILTGLFIACGPLQALYLYAAGTGSFLNGSLSLMAFGLGTLPVMIGFGSMASVISHKTTQKILKIAAILVLILGVIMLNRGLVVLGSPYSFEAIKGSVMGNSVEGFKSNAVIKGDYQEINMEVNRYGWEPDSFTLKRGVPVKWNINVKELTRCNNEIIVRDYGLDIKLKQGMNVVEFTPDKTGTVRWSCWMGMIPGVFVVTDDGAASESQLKEASVVKGSGGSCGGDGSCGSPTCGGATGGGCGCGG